MCTLGWRGIACSGSCLHTAGGSGCEGVPLKILAPAGYLNRQRRRCKGKALDRVSGVKTPGSKQHRADRARRLQRHCWLLRVFIQLHTVTACSGKTVFPLCFSSRRSPTQQWLWNTGGEVPVWCFGAARGRGFPCLGSCPGLAAVTCLQGRRQGSASNK